MISTLPLSATQPTPHARSVAPAQVTQSGAYQPRYYPYQGGSVHATNQPSASAGLDIGSLISMIMPIVMMGMMTRMMVSTNKKDEAGTEGEGEGEAVPVTAS